jgi:hypothetical protein
MMMEDDERQVILNTVKPVLRGHLLEKEKLPQYVL